MKRIISIVAAMSVCIALSAQEHIFDPRNLVSPEVHSDASVTFRLYAPDASEVFLTGDLTAGRDLPMKRGENAVWTVTVDPLESELYFYWFKVDGRKILDPSNSYVLRDVKTNMSWFIVPGDGNGKGDLYSAQNVGHGTVSKVWYRSGAMGCDRRLTVYTPAGYETSRRKYPVLYLLHGMGGDEEAWPTLGRATYIFDNLIAKGLAEPMIVVMSNGNLLHRSAPGESGEGLWQPYGCGSFDGSFEESFPEIVKFVDRRYRTVAKPSSRAVAGLSMGGLHTYMISLNYPEMFGNYGIFSGAVGSWWSRTGGVNSNGFYQDQPATIARLAAASPDVYYIAIGKDDFLYGENVELRRMLNAAGMEYTYVESAGGHIWANWRAYLSEFIQMIFK